MKQAFNEDLKKYNLSIQCYHGVAGWGYRIVTGMEGFGLPLTLYRPRQDMKLLIKKIKDYKKTDILALDMELNRRINQ